MTGIFTHPQSMNISLNGFAMFNCTAIASVITWEIDGVLIDGGIRDKVFDDFSICSDIELDTIICVVLH